MNNTHDDRGGAQKMHIYIYIIRMCVWAFVFVCLFCASYRELGRLKPLQQEASLWKKRRTVPMITRMTRRSISVHVLFAFVFFARFTQKMWLAEASTKRGQLVEAALHSIDDNKDD